MTLRGARLLSAAGLVVAEAEVADRVRHLLVADAAVAEPSSDAAGTAKVLVQAAKAGQFVVRLVVGDPLLSGGAAEVQAAPGRWSGTRSFLACPRRPESRRTRGSRWPPTARANSGSCTPTR
jgi:hypothetical protein